MVLTQPHSVLDDASPLALLRVRRDEADQELRKSLINASFMALTLVVAFMLGQIVLRGEPHETIAPTLPGDPPLPPPPNIFKVYVPFSPQVLVPVVIANGDVLPVDDKTQESDVPVIEPASPEGVSRDPGFVPGAIPGSGGGGTVPAADPKWGEYVYFEEAPELVTRVQPLYPGIAAQAGMEGSVSVRMLVGVDGRVKRAEIERSAPMFDEAALAAARQWIFTPAKSNGHPVAVWVLLPVEFKLR